MFRKLLLAGILAAAMAYAQRGGGMGGGDEMGGGRGGEMGGMGGAMPRAQRQSKADQLASKLKLNKEQKEQLQTILSAAREKAAPIRSEMDKQRAQIAGAMITGKTGDDLQKVVDGYTALSAQMTSVEADTYSKIYAMLKRNQQSKAEQSFELLAAVLNGPAGVRGMGRSRQEGR